MGFLFQSQQSKEQLLQQWYLEANKSTLTDQEIANTVVKFNSILEKDAEGAIEVIDKYLKLKVNDYSDCEYFIADMDSLRNLFAECLNYKESPYILTV